MHSSLIFIAKTSKQDGSGLKAAALAMKYVLVTGGVVSGLGKGVTASSIGVILKACGHRVTSIKIGGCCTQHPADKRSTFNI